MFILLGTAVSSDRTQSRLSSINLAGAVADGGDLCGLDADGRVDCWDGSDVGQIDVEPAERCYPFARMDEMFPGLAAGTTDPALRENLHKRLNEVEAQRFTCSARPLPVEGAPKLFTIEAGGTGT